MIECVRRSARNVKRSQSGRHVPALDRRRHARGKAPVRRIIGYADLSKLVPAIERELGQPTDPTPTEEAVIVATA
jgi:hypothetical protein